MVALPTWKHSKGHHDEVLSGASSKQGSDIAELRTEAVSPRKERPVKKQAQVAQRGYQRPGFGPERNRTGTRQKYRGRNKKIRQRRSNSSLSLEKSSKAQHSPSALINLPNKSRQTL